MIRTTLAAGALLLAVCGTAAATDNPALKKCMDGANTTADMVSCNVKETKVQDTRLNKAYKNRPRRPGRQPQAATAGPAAPVDQVP